MIEEPRLSQKTTLCIDGRMRATAATGVGTYSETVMAALTLCGHPAIRLEDLSGGRFGASAGPVERARRWIDARRGGRVTLSYGTDRLFARDVFRLSQARFARSGELLRLIAPGRGVMHWTYPIPARIEGWINLYTVHDVIPLTHPGMSQMAAPPLLARLVAIGGSADRIVTVSDSSREAIMRALHLPAEKVVNCGSAVPPPERGFAALPHDLKQGGYYLFCGMIEPRKNLPRILTAWRKSGTSRPFVITGPPCDTDLDLGDVVHLGYLPRPALQDIIAGARALVFPTLEEGFGLPVIEAMALGVPVITSNRGALAEVSGGAALAVDPEDEADISRAIAVIDRDDTACRSLRANGLVRASAFSLPAFGERLLRLYADLAGDSSLLP